MPVGLCCGLGHELRGILWGKAVPRSGSGPSVPGYAREAGLPWGPGVSESPGREVLPCRRDQGPHNSAGPGHQMWPCLWEGLWQCPCHRLGLVFRVVSVPGFPPSCSHLKVLVRLTPVTQGPGLSGELACAHPKQAHLSPGSRPAEAVRAVQARSLCAADAFIHSASVSCRPCSRNRAAVENRRGMPSRDTLGRKSHVQCVRWQRTGHAVHRGRAKGRHRLCFSHSSGASSPWALVSSTATQGLAAGTPPRCLPAVQADGHISSGARSLSSWIGRGCHSALGRGSPCAETQMSLGVHVPAWGPGQMSTPGIIESTGRVGLWH